MKEKKIIIEYQEYDEGENLSPDDTKLIKEAMKAVEGSYAPYSDFHVGAALLFENGKIILGSNQENAAYPSGLCAERVALFYAKSEFPNEKIVSIAITGKADHFVSGEPITPCGSCRQVLAETENRQASKIRIIMQGERGVTKIVNGVESLLPMVFHEEKLKKKL